MNEITSIEQIQQLAREGFTEWKTLGDVSVDRDGDLLIFNYTAKAQYEGRWNFFERVSRGLIINCKTGEIVARAFDKFFNWLQDGMKADGHIVSITEKMDGCFRFDTPLQCWDGTTVLIGDVVNKRQLPVLMGMDSDGQLVPCEIENWYNNGAKNNWLAITVDCPVSRKSGAGGHPNIIRITDNHHIFINGNFAPAFKARIGDKVSTYQYTPSSSVLHVVRSGLLGDGSLTHVHNGCRYQEGHIAKHKKYTDKIRNWLGECAAAERTTMSGYGSKMFWAQGKQYPILADLRDEWYPNEKKRIPERLDWVDHFSIAKWYMDDGSLVHSPEQQDRALFATQGFLEEDVRRLAQLLEKMYAVKVAVYFAKGWSLRINSGRKREIDNFWRSISPHVVPCMKYKLPKQYRNVEYVDYPRGKQEAELVDSRITAISPIEINKKNFPAGRIGFDIQTSTGNYFAKGILVHNSLGILYRRNDEYRISTRGSFHSDQAEWATKFLREHYKLDSLPNELTLLFEIIYPENRVVVNYRGRRDLVLLAARNRFTGAYLPFFPDLQLIADQYGFPLPKVYSFNNITEILELLGKLDKDDEGFVVEFSDGQRFKFKGDKYLELHRLVFSLSFKNTLQAIVTKQADYIRQQIPDEFLEDFNGWVAEIETTRERIKREVAAIFAQAPKETRKDFAIWVMSNHKDISSYLFAMMDGHDLEPIIYKKAFENRPNEMAVKQSENTA